MERTTATTTTRKGKEDGTTEESKHSKAQGGVNNKKNGVSILKYDTKAYNNFVHFEKELAEVVGYEFF